MKTGLDIKKQNADILIEYANGGSFTINIQNPSVVIKGRGVKKTMDNGFLEVTENKLNKLRSTYSIQPNF